MIAENLLTHLRELGVAVELSPDARSLALDAPTGVMTREMTDLLREHKEVLVELVYVTEERAAIMNESTEWAGPERVVKVRDDVAADERLVGYLKGRDDRRVIVGGVPQWEPPHVGNF